MREQKERPNGQERVKKSLRAQFFMAGQSPTSEL